VKVGDLVRAKPSLGPEEDAQDQCVGMITDFQSDHGYEKGWHRYAVVFWNEEYPSEEEYLDQIEVINESW